MGINLGSLRDIELWCLIVIILIDHRIERVFDFN